MKRIAALALFTVVFATALTEAAPPPMVGRGVHYQQKLFNSAPGAVGANQLTRGGPLAGYYQTVEIRAPEGAMVSLVVDEQFQPAQAAPVKAGLLIGQVYRFKITNIPLNEGREVFPTIEVVNRLYPPPGQEVRFPIPVELTREELEFALVGKYVTRVIYLENPQTAVASAQGPGRAQPYEDTYPEEDALERADRLGRPMAILRLGSRVPDSSTNLRQFTFGSPAFVEYGPAAPPNQAEQK